MSFEMKNIVKEVSEFYPEYLAAHSAKGNRVLHFAGASCFFILIILAFVLHTYWLAGIAIFVGYLLPGIGHRFFEHNESFRASKPLLCVICAFRMYIDTLTFREYRKVARFPKA